MKRRQPLSRPGEHPQAPSSFYATHSDDDERAPTECLHPALYSFAFVAGDGCGDISFTIQESHMTSVEQASESRRCAVIYNPTKISDKFHALM
jgi:hypothetical protein